MNDSGQRQRLDKWLWHARMVKTRPAAVSLIEAGFVRVNSKRAEQVAKPVGIGDILTLALPRRVVVLEILGIAERRGGFPEASKLYRMIDQPRGDEEP
jgi:ribosome-associated heat shock protein Hsp15